jgi:hypothetical protein
MHSTGGLQLDYGEQSCVGEDYVPDLKVDGESCQSNLECKSNLCSRGNCLGLPKGSACEGIEDCAAGLTCKQDAFGNQFCSEVSQTGESCSSEDECTNDSTCYLGICGKYFSISKGTYIGSGSSALLCETGYIEYGFCLTAPQNKQKADAECSSRSDCLLDSGAQGTCVCGFNTHGRAYCGAVAGDAEFLDFKDSLLSLIQINQDCHGSISYSERCPSLTKTDQIAEFLKTYYLYLYRPLVIGAPACVLNDLLPFGQGYEANSSASSTGSSALDTETILILGIVLPFFIVSAALCAYFIRRAHQNAQRLHHEQQEEELQIRVEMARSVMILQPSVLSSVQFDLADINFVNGHLTRGVPLAIETNPTTSDPVDTYTDICDGIVVRDKGHMDDEESATSFFTRVQPPRH